MFNLLKKALLFYDKAFYLREVYGSSIQIIQMQETNYGVFSKEEYEFLQNLRIMVKNDERIDYNQLRANPPTDNKGAFWFEFASILSELPNGDIMDMRKNGRLRVSLAVLNEMLKYNAKFPQIWATKITVLKYLVHGYSAMANSAMGVDKTTASEYQRLNKTYLKEFKEAIKQTEQRFPNDEWFKTEKEEMQESYELN